MSNSVDSIDDDITSINKDFYGFIAKTAKCAQCAKTAKCAQCAIDCAMNIMPDKCATELGPRTQELKAL